MNNHTILSGSLAYLSLGELLQLFGNNPVSGVMRLNSQHAEKTGFIYFKQGNPINAAYGDDFGIDVLNAFFGWMEGHFEFVEGPVKIKPMINKGRMEIILDALRLLDDGQIVKLGSGSGDTDQQSQAGVKKLGPPVIKGPLVDYLYVLEEESYGAGAKIVVEGKHGNWMWVILEGTVKVMKETPDGEVVVLKLGVGSFIGTIAFLTETSVRSATIVADTNVQLGVLDSQRLSREFASRDFEFREMIRSLLVRLKNVTTSSITNKDEEIKAYIKNGQLLVKQGGKPEDASGLFKIEEGRAIVFRTTPAGLIKFTTLGKGDVWGLIPFLNIGHEPASACVYGTSDIKSVPIDIEKMEEEYNRLTPILKKMMENVATSIAVTSGMACEIRKIKKGT